MRRRWKTGRRGVGGDGDAALDAEEMRMGADGDGEADAVLAPSVAFSFPHPNPKYFLFHPSHQIFRYRYGALNVGTKITNCIVYL
jgi:hypothetical protein